MPGSNRHLFLLVTVLALIMLITVSPARNNSPGGMAEAPATPGQETSTPPEVTVTTRFLRPDTGWETKLHIITAPEEGPVVMAMGGVHGDEVAGYLAADIIATWAIDRGTLLVLPRANMPAIATETRYAPGHCNLNASFPGSSTGNPTERLARAIYQVMEEFAPQWVIDLHEAQEFERVQYCALGQTLIYPPEAPSLETVEQIVQGLNRNLTEELHYYQVVRGGVRGGSIRAARSLELETFTVETTRKLPLEERVNQHLEAVRLLLAQLGITPYEKP